MKELLVSEPDNEEYLQMATALDEVRLAGIGFQSLGRSTARPVAPERGTHDGQLRLRGYRSHLREICLEERA